MPGSLGVATRPCKHFNKRHHMIIESEYKKYILERADPHFYIQKEHHGFLFGNKCRIDAIIKPRDISQWANKAIAFAVEFKHFVTPDDHSHSLNYYSKQFKQIIDYSYAEWKDYGRLPVLICPPLFNKYHYTERYSGAIQLIKNCMGQCNVGELTDHPKNGLSIYFNTHHRIWSERWGVSVGKEAQFRIKTGSGALL